jgi:hypothetical protein
MKKILFIVLLLLIFIFSMNGYSNQKVKLFKSENIYELEKSVNSFLSNIDVFLISIEYEITDYSKEGNNGWPYFIMYSCLIYYKLNN